MARIFSRNVSHKTRKKVSLSPGTEKKATENQFYPNQNTLDKSIDTACDVLPWRMNSSTGTSRWVLHTA